MSREEDVKKAHWNAIVDAFMLVVVLAVMSVGLLLGFVIGRGSGPQVNKYLWGLHRQDWGDIHLVLSLLLVGLVILHFILHMSWIRSMSKQCLGLHWLVTLGILFVIAVGIVCASVAIKRAYPGRWGREERELGAGGKRSIRTQDAPRPGRGGGRRIRTE